MKNGTRIVESNFSFTDNLNPNNSYTGTDRSESFQVLDYTSSTGDFVRPLPHTYRIRNISEFRGTSVVGPSGTTAVYTSKTGVHSNSGNFEIPDPLSSASEEGDLYNQALSKLYEQIRGGLDLSVSAFQAKQTARMFTATSALELLAKRNPLAKIGSKWLEYQYGWRPLINDIYSIADESLRFTLNNSQWFHATATNKSPLKGTAVFTLFGEFAPVKYSGSRSSGCKISVRMKQNQPQTELSRFTSLNPISIAWELVPYSFVVDWFFNVGSYLRNMETALLYSNDFEVGYVTYLYANDVLASTNFVENRFGLYYKYDLSGFHQKNVAFRRNVLSTAPLPVRPRIKTNLSSARLLNLAALLSQQLR